MAEVAYRQSPDHTLKTWPSGVKYIIGNEGCERFSFYGMNAILYIYVVSLYTQLYSSPDVAADMATSTVHLFKTGVYALPMIGAIIADRLLGKYRTIFWLSLVYCAGHAVLSMTEGTIWGMNLGLALIAIGSGGIKPCVSANVGDQFGRSNWNLVQKVYQAFYFIINFGSFFATLLIPLLKEWFGWRVAFLVPGVLMFIATVVFWAGRKEFVHIPAKPGGRIGLLDTASSIFLFLTVGSLFVTAHSPVWVMLTVSTASLLIGLVLFQRRQTVQADDGFMAVGIYSIKEFVKDLFAGERYEAVALAGGATAGIGSGPRIRDRVMERYGSEAVEGTLAVLRIISVFFGVSIFWALFDQHSSSWIRQAEMMNLTVSIPFLGSVELLASQVPSMNPILVMMLIPILLYGVFPALAKAGLHITPLRKMTVGMFIAGLAFMSVALLQSRIDALAVNGEKLNVMWQLIPYTLITLAEVLVSVTGLEFAYTQAPRRMKSTVMGFWLLTVALGNVLVALLARFSDLQLVDFFWLFSGLMVLAALLFGIRAAFYIVRDYPQ